MDAFLFERFRRLDAFPSRGDFDEDSVAGMAFFFVSGDELVCLGDGRGGVEGEPGIDLGGDAAGDDLEDFQTEQNQDAVEDRLRQRGTG